jgi:hypothetical protein
VETETDSTIEKWLRLFEHGAFLTALGIGGPLLMPLSKWFSILTGLCFLLAFHRSKLVKGRNLFRVQLPRYALSFAVGCSAGLGFRVAIEKQEDGLVSRIAALIRPKEAEPTVKAQVQTSLISMGGGSCSFFMRSWVSKDEIYASPVVFVSWIRLSSTLDHSIQVDSYSIDISSGAGGPWIETQVFPGNELYYTRDNSLNDRNSIGFRRAFEALSIGSAPLMQLGGLYAFSTVDDPGCMRKVSITKFVALSDQLKGGGLDAGGTAEGWVAFNPLEYERVLVGNRIGLFFRIKVNTSAGVFTSFGEFRSSIDDPIARISPDSIHMVKLGEDSADLTNEPLRYFGPTPQ